MQDIAPILPALAAVVILVLLFHPSRNSRP